MKRSIVFGVAAAVFACSPPSERARGTPAALADSLLDIDRGYSAAGADSNVVGSLRAMFSADVVMPAPGGRLVRGPDSVAALLASNPLNLASRVSWSPVRAGVSADGQQGFTMGYMEMQPADSTSIPMKYLAYWVREPSGWRVRAYKRGRRPIGTVPTAVMAPALPPSLVSPVEDTTVILRFADELGDAERAFSDEARKAGLGPAFATYGRADAMHLGGPDDTAFVISAAAIGAGVGAGETGGARISWGPEEVVVASSGDLGVSIGLIVPDPDSSSTAGPAPRYAFFTVWRRDSTSEPWRYVAE
jgi:hypothetical protein